MSEDRTRKWWGQEFRIVAEGLAETDVVVFVERLIRENHEALGKVDHINSLHKLAARIIEDARDSGVGTKDEAAGEAEDEAAKIIAAAEDKRQEILEEAGKEALARLEAARGPVANIQMEQREQARQRLAGIEAALEDLKEAAIQELSGRMKPHYLAKYLAQSVHFLSSFAELIKGVETQPQAVVHGDTEDHTPGREMPPQDS